MSKKEREICDFKMDLKNFFCLRSNLTNDNIICLKARSENGYGFWRSSLKTHLGEGRGGEMANGNVPLDGVAFSRLD